jgi:hypothetical protein
VIEDIEFEEEGVDGRAEIIAKAAQQPGMAGRQLLADVLPVAVQQSRLQHRLRISQAPGPPNS